MKTQCRCRTLLNRVRARGATRGASPEDVEAIFRVAPHHAQVLHRRRARATGSHLLPAIRLTQSLLQCLPPRLPAVMPQIAEGAASGPAPVDVEAVRSIAPDGSEAAPHRRGPIAGQLLPTIRLTRQTTTNLYGRYI